MAFGAADYAHDVRLACHGLDRDDNDFVIGLIGKDLFPLSAVVQSMRKTQQTVALPRSARAVLHRPRRLARRDGLTPLPALASGLQRVGNSTAFPPVLN